MPDTTPVKVAVLTGGHGFDVPPFRDLFLALDGVDAYVQHVDDWACGTARRPFYDVVLFYHMLPGDPLEQGPWYQGNHRAAVEALGATPQGVVVLHHALLAWPQWRLWSDLVGITDRHFSSYHHDQQLHVEVAAQQHPITAGLSDFDVVDETYVMADPDPVGNTPLLTVDHPHSMRTLAWTREYRQARVFCYESGHDGTCFANPDFREVLRRGILWSGRRLG